MTIPPLPYGQMLKWGGVAAVLLAAFIGGCRTQKKMDKAEISRAETALQASGAALAAASSAIVDINQEAERRLAEAKRQQKASAEAAKVADAAKHDAEARAQRFSDKLSQAAKRKPDCAQLLAMDLEAVCGVSSR